MLISLLEIRYSNILDIIDSYDLFKNIYKRIQINELNTKKLIKAIKLVQLGISEHYTLKCMPITNERIDWAIDFRKKGLCDLFCWRGALEFNESQKNNLNFDSPPIQQVNQSVPDFQ